MVDLVEHLTRIDAERNGLNKAKMAVEAAELGVRMAIAEAQSDGVTWQQIADHFGVTRQAAWDRWRLPE